MTLGVETLFEVGEQPLHLFRVMPGVSFELADEQVSVLLGLIKHLVRE